MTSFPTTRPLDVILVEEALPPEFAFPHFADADQTCVAIFSADDPGRGRLLLRAMRDSSGTSVHVSHEDRRTAQFDLNLRSAASTELLFTLVASDGTMAASSRRILLATPNLMVPLLMDEGDRVHACRSDILERGGIGLSAAPIRPILALFDRGPGPRTDSNHVRFSKLADFQPEIDLIKDTVAQYGLILSQAPITFG
jgi:hypothetical protein